MVYFPVLDALRKHLKHIHDFLLELPMLLLTYLVDRWAYGMGYNVPALSLLVLAVCFVAAYVVIRAMKKQDAFSAFGRHGFAYGLFMAWGAWIGYLVFARLRVIPTHWWMFLPRL